MVVLYEMSTHWLQGTERPPLMSLLTCPNTGLSHTLSQNIQRGWCCWEYGLRRKLTNVYREQQRQNNTVYLVSDSYRFNRIQWLSIMACHQIHCFVNALAIVSFLT